MHFPSFRLFLFAAVSVQNASSAGFFIPNQDAEATARGNAFVATADRASAVYYNPAGLTQFDQFTAQAGVYAISLGNDFTSPTGASFDTESSIQAVPHLYFAAPVADNLVLGAGLNVPFGLSTDWGNDPANPLRFAATESEFSYLSGYLVAGYKINDSLSIGAGLTLNRADTELSRFDPLSGGILTLEGDAVTLGGLFGIHYRPNQQHSFGATFRTGSSFTFEGSATLEALSFRGDAEVDFDIPATAAFGYAFRPNDRLTIELNIEWVGWDALDSYDVTINGGPGGTLNFEWESTLIYEIGATYRLTESLSLHAGYDFNEGAQPDEFFNPAVADADRHWINFGLSQDLGDLSWALGYSFGWSDHTVNDSVINTNGEFSARHHALTSSLSYRF